MFVTLNKCFWQCCYQNKVNGSELDVATCSDENIGVNFGWPGGQCPLRSDTKGGKISLAPLFFWQVIPIWQQKIQNSGLR